MPLDGVVEAQHSSQPGGTWPVGARSECTSRRDLRREERQPAWDKTTPARAPRRAGDSIRADPVTAGAPGGQIFRKYALTFVLLVGAVLLTSGLVELSFSYEENQAALSRIQREQVASAATRIEQFVQETRGQIGAASGAVARGPDRDDLLRLLRLSPAVTEVAYLNESGKEQVFGSGSHSVHLTGMTR
jgi:hypothetical protein